MGGTNLDNIPWLDSLRASAQRPGHGCTGNVEHNGNLARLSRRPLERYRVAQENGSDEARLR